MKARQDKNTHIILLHMKIKVLKLNFLKQVK